MTKKYIEDTDIDIGTFTSVTLTPYSGDFCFGEVKYKNAFVSGGYVLNSEGITLPQTTYIATMNGSVWPSTPCPYCGTHGGEDKHHLGTCANCGAVL